MNICSLLFFPKYIVSMGLKARKKIAGSVERIRFRWLEKKGKKGSLKVDHPVMENVKL